jgi:AmmeMemoRadiSam system protein B
MFRRPMDFAGSWYPAGRDACREEIETYWREAEPSPVSGARLAVVPHAGWVYSGRLAARGFRALSEDPAVDLVIVLGGHLRSSDPIIAMTEGSWDTPLGPFIIHSGFSERLSRFERVRLEREGRYSPDNSTELQLPFAKHKFPEAELLPLRVPPSTLAIELGQSIFDYLSETRRDAVVVASTDLTHYGPNYGFQPKGRGLEALNWVRTVNDPSFIQAVESGDPQAVLSISEHRHCACSAGAVAAAATIATRGGLTFRFLEYATSADIAGESSENFVGYLAGAYA